MPRIKIIKYLLFCNPKPILSVILIKSKEIERKKKQNCEKQKKTEKTKESNI